MVLSIDGDDGLRGLDLAYWGPCLHECVFRDQPANKVYTISGLHAANYDMIFARSTGEQGDDIQKQITDIEGKLQYLRGFL